MDKICCNCMHYDLSSGERPCCDCKHFDKWEPATDVVEIATAPVEPCNDTEGAAVDMVNRPPHYTHGQYECIDVMVDTFGKEAVQHFCVLNAFKYIWRSEHKNGLEDVKKAWWYLDKYLELEAKPNE